MCCLETLSPKKNEAQKNQLENSGAIESATSSKIAEVDDTEPLDSPISVEPVTVREPFPYLTTSGLSPEEKDVYLERLILESMDIRYKFGRLASDTQISLQSRKVKVKIISNEVMAFYPLYHDNVFKYRDIDTPTVMGLLSESWNFVIYGILEHIIVKLGTVEDQANLEAYKKSLCEYSKRRMLECPEGIFGGSKKVDEKEMVVKMANKATSIYDTTLEDVQKIVSKFKKVMNVEEFGMRLISIGVEDHHTVFFFGVNTLLVRSESMFPLTQKKKERLMARHIWHISCGEFIFQHKLQVS